MRGINRFMTVAAAVALMGVGAGFGAAPAFAQNAKQMQKLDGHPNLNGIWEVVNGANYNIEPHSAAPNPVADRQVGATGAIPAGLGVVEGGKIPYKPEAMDRLKQNQDHLISWDPEAACYLPGIPRASYMPHPFQIIQGSGDDLLMVYEYASANRVVSMEEVGIPPIDTWMGTSYGKWDGDTLEVVTLAQSPGDVILPGGEMIDGVTWLDRNGNYLTNTATVTERFTPMDDSHLRYEVKIDDPSIYTKPWSMEMVLYKHVEPNAQLLEFKCVPFSEQLLYGDLLDQKGGK